MKTLFDDPIERANFRLVMAAVFAHGMLASGGTRIPLVDAQAKALLEDAETLADVVLARAETYVNEQAKK